MSVCGLGGTVHRNLVMVPCTPYVRIFFFFLMRTAYKMKVVWVSLVLYRNRFQWWCSVGTVSVGKVGPGSLSTAWEFSNGSERKLKVSGSLVYEKAHILIASSEIVAENLMDPVSISR